MRIELYPEHDDFSVRSVGLAGVGLLGVAFGPVVVMDSPAARARGAFNWGSTLWHELAHVFHLSMTRNRVPRWFSEGLAVHEERRARPGWGADVDPGFLLAYLDGRLLPLSPAEQRLRASDLRRNRSSTPISRPRWYSNSSNRAGVST